MGDPNNTPVQNDIDQDVNSGNLAPTQTVQNDTQTPMRPAGQMNQSPAQTTTTQPQPSSGAVPTNAAQPKAPTPEPPSLRSRIFDTILKAGAGTPIQGPDGKPLPMTRGVMGKAILANALAGMMAGYSTSETVNGKFGPTRVNNPAKAAAAGAQAGQQQQQQRQQQMDESQARAYNTVKRNLDLHATMMNAQKMDYEQQKSLLGDTQPLLDGLESFDNANTDPSVPKLILDRGLTGDELMQKYHVAKNNAILDGWRPHIDPQTGKQAEENGVPQYEPTFTAISDQAILHFNEDLRNKLAAQNPDMARIPLNTPIQAKALLGMIQNNMNLQIAQTALNKWAGKNDELSGNKEGTKVNVQDLIQKNPTVRRAVPFINKYIGEDPDVMLAGLRKEKDPTAQAAAGIIASSLGIDEDKWKQKRENDTKTVANDAAIEKEKQTSEITLQREKKLAAYKKTLDLSSGSQVVSDQPFQFDYADKTGHHWDLTSQATKLVEGTEDPMQLTKRAKNYDQIIKDSDAYSRARYGTAYNLAQAQIDFKEAQNPSTRSTLRYLNSLTGSGPDNTTGNPNGNLAELSKLSKSIGRTDFPALNDKAAWLRLQTGDPKIAAYKTAATEIADQVGKILQGGGAGGGTSDAKLKQAQEMFATGFSTDQLDAVVAELRPLLSNRQKSMIQDNRYLEKQFGKYLSPPDGAMSKMVNNTTGQIAYKMKDGKIVDAFGRPVQTQ